MKISKIIISLILVTRFSKSTIGNLKILDSLGSLIMALKGTWNQKLVNSPNFSDF